MVVTKRSASRLSRPDHGAQDFLEGVALNRSMPLRDQIYAVVRRAIVTGHLPPGTVINEIEIAERLGLSRTPVREAVKKVSDEGLVDVHAQSGTFVAEINRAQVEEAYIVRIALECESVARAAPLMNETHRHNLEDIIERHGTALSRGRFDEAIARDDDFHRYIAQISNLVMLWKMVDTCKAQMDRCRILTVPRPGHGSTTIEQHRAILAALAAKKAKPAIAALRDHLDTSLGNTLTWFAERDKLQ
jgi:GntR family transcriptional regulator, rspAB operon transcriptional repressor